MYIILAFIKEFWKPLFIALIVIILILSARIYAARQYHAGVSDATATLQSKLDIINAKQAQKMAQASADYQAEKTKREKEQGVQYVEVEKIVEKPIYINVCLDDDGLREINSAAGHK